MSILEWVAHFKNIRCLLLFDPESPPAEEAIGWIVKRHRWRQVGIGESLADLHPRFKDHPFVPLAYPSQEIKGVVKGLAEGSPLWLLESVALALCYSAPLLCFEREVFDALEPLLTWVLRAADVPEAEEIRHLRISGYVPVDFFPQVKESFLALKEGGEALEKLIERRKEEAERDGRKRFWRLKERPEAPPFVGYLDLLPPLARERERIVPFLEEETVGLLLSITAALHFWPPPWGRPKGEGG